jgi:hypothetical protein
MNRRATKIKAYAPTYRLDISVEHREVRSGTIDALPSPLGEWFAKDPPPLPFKSVHVNGTPPMTSWSSWTSNWLTVLMLMIGCGSATSGSTLAADSIACTLANLWIPCHFLGKEVEKPLITNVSSGLDAKCELKRLPLGPSRMRFACSFVMITPCSWEHE